LRNRASGPISPGFYLGNHQNRSYIRPSSIWQFQVIREAMWCAHQDPPILI
jgi:hypothetical protein